MRPASLYLGQTWTADLYRQARRAAPARAASRARTRGHHGVGTARARARPLPRAACSRCWAAAARDRTGHRANPPRHRPWPAAQAQGPPAEDPAPARWPLAHRNPHDRRPS
jgi:hypothetical protein